MAQREIPEDTIKLIHDCFHSVEQLEVFLLIRTQSSREWTALEVSQELRIQHESALNRLSSLVEHKLVRVVSTASLSPADTDAPYCYAPATPALAKASAGLADAYRERKYTVIDLIFAKPEDPIRLFSDAFRIRRND